MVLVAAAPAPLTATPASPATPAARDAATDRAWISASVVAVKPTAPLVVLTSAFWINASTSLVIKLLATETPMEMATPALPAKAAAMDAAPASALMVDESCAVREANLTSMPVPLSPSINALTKVAIRLSVTTPEPLAATPPVPPPATAAEPAPTPAVMLPPDVAFSLKSSLLTVEFWIYANTSIGWRSSPL